MSYGYEAPARAGNQGFIQDVISFIDQPLSPQSLHKLKKSCKSQGYGQAALQQEDLQKYATQQTAVPIATGSPVGDASQPDDAAQGWASSGLAVLFPMGTEIEAQHLTNTTEFNGLRGSVVGHQDDKVLVAFHGGSGQVFDIPSYNLRVVSPPAQPSPGAPPSTTAPPAPAPVAPVHSYSPPQTQTPAESVTLQAKLKCAMSHVDSAKDAMRIATQLHVVDAEALYVIIAEFQPTLTRANIAKNWAKIIQIYQAHAERVEHGVAQEASPVATSSPSQFASPAPHSVTTAPADMANNLQGVINFIDAPLSPRTLKEVRTIRHSLSPRRGRSGSPAA